MSLTDSVLDEAGGWEPIVPWRADAQIFATPNASTQGTWTLLQSSTAFRGGIVYNFDGSTIAAVGDNISWMLSLPAGTWTMDVLCNKLAIGGQASIAFGGTTIGTIDTYNSSSVPAKLTTSGIVIPAAKTALLTVTVTGKNASSTNWYVELSGILFSRTS